MRLTLLRAKEALVSHAPADVLEERINRAQERIIISGKFNGSLDRIALKVRYGDITLPRQYRTVEGVKIDHDSNGDYRVRTLTNAWYEFLEGKVSLSDSDRSGTGMDNVRSLGDGHALMHDLPLDGTLKATTTGTVPLNVTLYGRDTTGMPIELNITNNTPVANPFIGVTRLHKEMTDAPVQLSHFDADAVETVLALVEPFEEDTFYRRYRDDSLTCIAEANVIAYAKWRHLETTSDKDILRITNITALGMEMDSLQYLAENDHTVAEQYHQLAIKTLNDELKDSHSVDETPTLRMHYPGGPPRLTSHY